jgi:hypothetical protein
MGQFPRDGRMSWPSRSCSESRACYDFKCLRRLRDEIRQIPEQNQKIAGLSEYQNIVKRVSSDLLRRPLANMKEKTAYPPLPKGPKCRLSV